MQSRNTAEEKMAFKYFDGTQFSKVMAPVNVRIVEILK